MNEEQPIEVIRSDTARLFGLAMWVGLIVVSAWVLAAVGFVGLWLVASHLFLGAIAWAVTGRPKVVIYRHRFLVVMPFSSSWVRWEDALRFRIDAHPAWGLLGYVDLAGGSSLPLWMTQARKWQEKAGLDEPWRRIDHLNDLLGEFSDKDG